MSDSSWDEAVLRKCGRCNHDFNKMPSGELMPIWGPDVPAPPPPPAPAPFAAPLPSPQPAALPPPGWRHDPTHRHEHRYWDGAKWTHDVANAGVPAQGPAELN